MISIWKYRDFTPMLLKEIDKPFNSKDYLYEIKFDGYRALIFVNQKDIQIKSRNHVDITYLYPELQNIKKLFNKNTIIDGEIIIMDKGGPSFSKLQERSKLKDKSKIKYNSINNPVIFVAFDILYENNNLTKLSLIERKKVLDKYDENEYFIKSKIYDDGIKLFNEVKKRGLEGIVAKRKDSIYEANTRTDNWLKIKNIKEDDFYIGGYEINKIGLSILLGEIKNNDLYYIGKASLNKKTNLYKKVIKLKNNNQSPFTNYNAKAYYVKQPLKCTVRYLEKTRNNSLRHPIIKDE